MKVTKKLHQENDRFSSILNLTRNPVIGVFWRLSERQSAQEDLTSSMPYFLLINFVTSSSLHRHEDNLLLDVEKFSGCCWLEHLLIFPYIGNNHPNWRIFFRGVETTNQTCSLGESRRSPSGFHRGSFTLRLIIGRMVFQRMSYARRAFPGDDMIWRPWNGEFQDPKISPKTRP